MFNNILQGQLVACLVRPECETAEVASSNYEGLVKWRLCDQGEDAPRTIRGCEDCSAGESSADGGADCVTCEEGSFNGVVGATICESCSDELPFSDAGSVDAGACTPSPEGCVQVKIEGCENAYSGAYPTGGVYDVYDGDCEEGDQEGRMVYYNYASRLFLFFYPTWNHWVSSDVCGSVEITYRYANGVAGEFPFVSTANKWKCKDGFSSGSSYIWDAVTVTCSLYASDQAPCRSGTFRETGMGEAGQCTKCPLGLESSPLASISAEQCFTVMTNVLVSSGDDILAYNGDDNGFHNAIENVLQGYYDPTTHFISDSEFLTIGYLNGDHERDEEILIIDSSGLQRVFASPTVTRFSYMVFLPLLNQLAVWTHLTQGGVWRNLIIFFNVGDFDGTPLTEADAVGDLDGTIQVGNGGNNNEPPLVQSMHVGEGGTDVILHVFFGSSTYRTVLRFCVPNTSCDSEKSKILVPTTKYLRHVGVIHARGSYLVVVASDISSTNSPVAERVYECAFETSVTSVRDDCSVFAYRPEFKDWEPERVFVDEDKELVYVVDGDGWVYPDAILVFDFDGNFFGRFGEWSGGVNDKIIAISFVPGPFGPLSPIQPPPTATAGVPISLPLTLRTRLNEYIPADYPIANHTHRYEMTAMSEVTFDVGDGITKSMNITLPGEVVFSPDAPPHASLTPTMTLNIPGVWTISITESIFASKQNVLHSPFTITVDPAPLDSVLTRSTFSKVVTAGFNFTANIQPFDEFNNPAFFPSDSLLFSSFLNDEPAPTNFTFSPVPSDASFDLTERVTTAGSHELRIEFGDQELASSPFHFEVKPGAPSAASSTPNIAVGNELVSEKEILQELRVLPKDWFGNAITDATGYAVSIDGDDDISLFAPDFSFTHTISADFEGEIELRFTLDSILIKNSPVTIKVIRPQTTHMTTENVYIGVFGLMLAVGLILVTKMLLTNSANDVNIMTTGAEMAGIMKSMATNTLDPITDFLSWFLVVSVCGGWVSNLYLVFVIVAFGATALSLYTSVKQLLFLSDYKEEQDFGSDELEEEFKSLKKKYPESNIVAEGAQ